MNIASYFDRQARRTPDAVALRWRTGTLSYGALRDLARRFARLLHQRGVRRRDRIAILLPNDPAFVVALLGTFWHGATAVALSPAWAAEDAARALLDAEACLLITTEALAAAIGAPPESTLTVDDAADMGALGAALRAQVLTGDAEPSPRAEGAPATILYSSGTTGTPRGVVLTHGNLVFNALSKIRYCEITPRDRLALVVPISHCFGQNVVLLGALLAGASVQLYPRFDPEALGEDILAEGVSMLMAAPTAFARMLALGNEASLRQLRFGLSAAAPLGEELAARWREASGQSLRQGYGLTESSPFAAFDNAAAETGRRVGRAVDGVRIRIAALDGVGWMADGVPGEIVVKGPNVMSGYWRKPAATARALRDGWLHTGDLGWIDDAGALHLMDRIDDAINVAGFKVWPSDVERVLLRHPMVRDVAAYALPDSLRGSIVAAAIVAKAGATIDLDELARFGAGSLASYQRPARLYLVDGLPRSTGGKILRRTLVAEGQRLPHATPTNTDRPATGFPAPSR